MIMCSFLRPAQNSESIRYLELPCLKASVVQHGKQKGILSMKQELDGRQHNPLLIEWTDRETMLDAEDSGRLKILRDELQLFLVYVLASLPAFRVARIQEATLESSATKCVRTPSRTQTSLRR